MSLENNEESKNELIGPVIRLVNEDGDVRERVRKLVVNALLKREADPQAIKDVMQSTMEGIGQGLGQRAQETGEALKQAVSGLDEAIGSSVYALRKAMEEGWSQGRQFAQTDMKETFDSLKGLEEEFLRVIRDAGDKTQGTLRTEFDNLREHLGNSGSDTGRQAREVLEVLGNRLNSSAAGSGQEAKAAIEEAGERLRAVASGILRGLADVLDKR